MEQKILYLYSLNETKSLGLTLGQLAEPADLICLDGDLGAGKTSLTQFIGKGLEVADGTYITSPSFSILHEYSGRIPLYHMDFYRLASVDEVIDLGFEEYFYLSGLTVIEWSKRAVEILPANRLQLEITVIDQDTRRVCFSFGEGTWQTRLEPFLMTLQRSGGGRQ